MRVINPDGEMLGIYAIHQALAIARELDLDLVEINPKADPPVCRIMDYGRYKYEQKKQENLAKKKRSEIELKEVKLRPKTDDHDFNFKMNHVRRFLSEGNKAKITIRFRGREMAHPEVAKARFDQIIEMMSDIATVEQGYRFEGRTMHIILAPKESKKPQGGKEGGKKRHDSKGGGKKSGTSVRSGKGEKRESEPGTE